MKKKKMLTRSAALLLVLILAVPAAGCKKKDGDKTDVTVTDTPATATAAPTSAPATPTPAQATPTPTPKPTAEPTAEPEPEPTDEPQDLRDEPVKVGSIKELFEAVKPGAAIIVEPGKYNITEYLSTLESEGGLKAWNNEHEYVSVEEVFDGYQIAISNVDGIHIMGNGANRADTEIVTDPRYAAVLTFYDCKDVHVSNLTMGHTERGDCSGNVIDLIACEQVLLENVDLYGCGVNGIGTAQGTGPLTVSNSVIRDCSSGPFDINDPKGHFIFSDTVLTGSLWGGFFDQNFSSSLSFIRCTFGDGETNEWYFADHVYLEDCTFGEVTHYPEYGDFDFDLPELDMDSLKMIPADSESIAGSGWTGTYTQDVITNRLTYIASPDDNFRDIAVAFYTEDYLPGEGWLEYDGVIYDLHWSITEDGVIRLETTEFGTLFASLFETSYAGEDFGVYWMRLVNGDETFWLY